MAMNGLAVSKGTLTRLCFLFVCFPSIALENASHASMRFAFFQIGGASERSSFSTLCAIARHLLNKSDLGVLLLAPPSLLHSFFATILHIDASWKLQGAEFLPLTKKTRLVPKNAAGTIREYSGTSVNGKKRCLIGEKRRW